MLDYKFHKDQSSITPELVEQTLDLNNWQSEKSSTYSPIQPNFSGKKSVCSNPLISATHGIIDGKILKITERGSHSFELEDGNYYWKDTKKDTSEPDIIWVRINVINYDDIKFSTH